MTDLSGTYNKVIFDLTGRIVHLCCQFNVKRNFRQFRDSELRKTAKMKNQPLKAEKDRQLQVILLNAGDFFKSTSSVEALEKNRLLLAKRHKYKSHPELPLLFKYFGWYQDVLIQSFDSQNIPTTNNLTERFFGHIRHKLKNFRGWKQKETVLGYIQVLALYRNYLALRNSSLAIKSIRTGTNIDLNSLTFSEYLFEFYNDITVSSVNVLPIHTSTNWSNFYDCL